MDDISKFKTSWFLLENGIKVDEVPKEYKGYVSYWSAFPCQIIKSVDDYIFQPTHWWEKVLLGINPRLKYKWNVTKGRTFKRFYDYDFPCNGMSDEKPFTCDDNKCLDCPFGMS